MKSELDAIMHSRSLVALLVTGPAQHNPSMYYFTGGGHLTRAELIKKRNEAPVLFYQPMEREEAAKTGLAVRNLADYNLNDLLKEAGGDYLQASILRYHHILCDLGITSGRVAITGMTDAGAAYSLFTGLQKLLPDLTFIGETDNSAILQAMATKDNDEIERIRRMAQVTTRVVGKTAEYLTSHTAEDGVLVKRDGQPLTIGDVKSRINLWLAEQGVENPEGTIFAIADEAGVPHSSGSPERLIRLGQTIVYDIFPCEAGGGYYYDFTRTWCLGYAPDEVMALYETVLDVYQQITSELKAGTHCPVYQKRACDMFEAKGHATIQTDPATQEGYVHGLGHGVGLHVHERPWFGKNASEEDILAPGSVFTIEPGLYYPERGMGVRLENTLWVRPDGQMEVFADYPMDLVLPVKG